MHPKCQVQVYDGQSGYQSADDHRKQKIITNDENSEFTGIYTIKKMQKTLAQVQLWDAKSLLRVVM